MAHYSWPRRAAATCLVAVLAAFFLAGRTDAISIRLPLSELSALSPLVVSGRVERLESAWNDQGQIDSTAYVRLTDAPRGHLSAGDLIPVRVHGGTVDGLTMVSSEEPTFQAGEDVLLFLGGRQGDAYRMAAGEQSKFKIEGDRAVNRAWGKRLRVADLKGGVQHGRWPAEAELSGDGPAQSWSATDPFASSEPGTAGAETTATAAPDSYVLNNAKWFGANPMGELFKINVNSDDTGKGNGSAEEFRNAILAAAYAWNSAQTAFSFKYGGLTGATSWANDGQNVVYWENLGNSTTLAQAQWWVSNGEIIDADLRFNDYYAWDATGDPSSNEPDLQSIATHELGHWLSLGHDSDTSCPNSTSVMCATYVLGRVKRVLGPNDIAGIKAIYGSPAKVRIFLPLLRR